MRPPRPNPTFSTRAVEWRFWPGRGTRMRVGTRRSDSPTGAAGQHRRLHDVARHAAPDRGAIWQGAAHLGDGIAAFRPRAGVAYPTKSQTTLAASLRATTKISTSSTWNDLIAGLINSLEDSFRCRSQAAPASRVSLTDGLGVTRAHVQGKKQNIIDIVMIFDQQSIYQHGAAPG